MVTEPGNYTEGAVSPIPRLRRVLPRKRGRLLAGAAAPGAETFDLARLSRRNVVRTASHLTDETLLLDLAAELAQRLLELLGVLDDYPHNPTRIQAERRGSLCKLQDVWPHSAAHRDRDENQRVDRDHHERVGRVDRRERRGKLEGGRLDQRAHRGAHTHSSTALAGFVTERYGLIAPRVTLAECLAPLCAVQVTETFSPGR